MVNDLVVKSQGPNEFTGAGLIESGATVFQNLDKDPFTQYVNIGVASLDLLAVIANPLEEFAKAGIGWIIEHVDFLRELVEGRTGDQNAVAALAQTWKKVAGELQGAADAYKQQMTGLPNWKGDAADAYKKTAEQYQKALQGAAQWAQATSLGIAVAGGVVAFVKGVVMDLLCGGIAKMIFWAIAALASSVVTLGATIVACTVKLVIDAVNLAATIVTKLRELLRAMAAWCRQAGKLRDAMQTAAKSFDNAADLIFTARTNLLRNMMNLGRNLAKNVPAVNTWKGGSLNRIDQAKTFVKDGPELFTEEQKNFIGDHYTTVAKEAGKAARPTYWPRCGPAPTGISPSTPTTRGSSRPYVRWRPAASTCRARWPTCCSPTWTGRPCRHRSCRPGRRRR